MSGVAVGNDVVDLCDPAALRSHDNPRFVARVCDPAERERVGSARDLWTLFAAKEAAYKTLVKLGAAPGFGHRSIHVAPDLASVAWERLRLSLCVTGDSEHVHAVAWSEGAPPEVSFARTCHPTHQEGERARALLCEVVAAAIECEAGELTVVRDRAVGAWDGYGPPYVERAGARVDADVSLSHDGRFVAAVALVRSYGERTDRQRLSGRGRRARRPSDRT